MKTTYNNTIYYYYNRPVNNFLLDFIYEFSDNRLDKTSITFKIDDNLLIEYYENIHDQIIKYYNYYYGSTILYEEIVNKYANAFVNIWEIEDGYITLIIVKPTKNSIINFGLYIYYSREIPYNEWK